MTLRMNDTTTVHKLIRMAKEEKGINVILDEETRIPARSEIFVEGKVQLTNEDAKSTIELMDMLLAKKRVSDRKAWLETKGNLAQVN